MENKSLEEAGMWWTDEDYNRVQLKWLSVVRGSVVKRISLNSEKIGVLNLNDEEKKLYRGAGAVIFIFDKSGMVIDIFYPLDSDKTYFGVLRNSMDYVKANKDRGYIMVGLASCYEIVDPRDGSNFEWLLMQIKGGVE